MNANTARADSWLSPNADTLLVVVFSTRPNAGTLHMMFSISPNTDTPQAVPSSATNLAGAVTTSQATFSTTTSAIALLNGQDTSTSPGVPKTAHSTDADILPGLNKDQEWPSSTINWFLYI